MRRYEMENHNIIFGHSFKLPLSSVRLIFVIFVVSAMIFLFAQKPHQFHSLRCTCLMDCLGSIKIAFVRMANVRILHAIILIMVIKWRTRHNCLPIVGVQVQVRDFDAINIKSISRNSFRKFWEIAFSTCNFAWIKFPSPNRSSFNYLIQSNGAHNGFSFALRSNVKCWKKLRHRTFRAIYHCRQSSNEFWNKDIVEVKNNNNCTKSVHRTMCGGFGGSVKIIVPPLSCCTIGFACVALLNVRRGRCATPLFMCVCSFAVRIFHSFASSGKRSVVNNECDAFIWYTR